MKPRYEQPPYQPKWVLQAQVWMLRHHVLPAFNSQSMVITTSGRKSGRRHSVPIGFARDGGTYVAINMGGHSNWYLNALASHRATLEVDGKTFDACAEPAPVDTPTGLQSMLDIYRRERPGTFEKFLGIPLDAPAESLMDIGKYVTFIRFIPLR
jgi:deazaflavin-dependent oxidoreductase (nitroreductase family)